jgi:hypothetical protein
MTQPTPETPGADPWERIRREVYIRSGVQLQRHICEAVAHFMATERQQSADQIAKLKARCDEFKRIGQGFERDYRNTFEQSCKNLQRAEAAEAQVATLTTERDHWKAMCDAVNSNSGDLFMALRKAKQEVATLTTTVERLEKAIHGHLCKHDAADWLACAGHPGDKPYCKVCEEAGDTKHFHGQLAELQQLRQQLAARDAEIEGLENYVEDLRTICEQANIDPDAARAALAGSDPTPGETR